MQYYAKSLNRELSLREKNDLLESIETILKSIEEEFTDVEKKVFEHWKKELYSEKNNHQKTLKEHEDDIVSCANMFFEKYGGYFSLKEKQLITEACRMHDWGKVNIIFQSLVNPDIKIDKSISQIPHGFLSAITISKREFMQLSDLFEPDDFAPFITAVTYHHDRQDVYDEVEIKEYCKKYYIDYISSYLGENRQKMYCSNRNSLLFKNNIYSPSILIDDKKWCEYALIKGMLNKFDYTVSAEYSEAELETDLKEKRLKSSIESSFKEFKLRPAQEYMNKENDKNLVIVAPTGSGKTEAALLWLNGEKGFYTLPLKVSSNAIYSRIKEKYNYESVSILHSDSMQKYLEEYSDTEAGAYEQYQRAKMLAKPLTVCTIDQIFKFVYKAVGTEILASTMKYSKVILDEVQAYSPRVIATIIYGLKLVNELGGKFAIITATFPPVLKYFMEKYGLIENKNYVFRDFSGESELLRHKIEIRGEQFDFNEILELGDRQKVLIICNTVTSAQNIYEELRDASENVYLLHSRYIRKDRELLEKMIMDFSNDPDATGIWITTQIVEASLDIDFDILYTEMCTADSLLQRMGRCNRKGRYYPYEPNIIVIVNNNGVGKKSVYEEELYRRSLKELQNYQNKVLSEKMKSDYINSVYCAKEIENSEYYCNIKAFLDYFEKIHLAEYTKDEADEKFRDIDSITIVPDNIYKANQALFDAGQKIIKKPYMGSEVRSMLNAKLESFTMSINLHGRIPDGIDKMCIGQDGKYSKKGIHIARLKYDFNLVTKKGAGLMLNMIEDEQYII